VKKKKNKHELHQVQVDIPEQITAEETSTETIVETTPVKETAETIEEKTE